MDPFLLFMFHVISLCYAILPCVHLLGKGWPLDSLVCCVFLCFVTFPYGVSGQVLYLVVSIPDLCLPLYFKWVCVLMSPHHGATVGWFVIVPFPGPAHMRNKAGCSTLTVFFVHCDCQCSITIRHGAAGWLVCIV